MTPSFNDLYVSVLADLRNKLSVSSIIGKVVINAFSLVQAAKLKVYYLRSAFVYKNIFIDQAVPESEGGALERIGLTYLGRLPLPATAGEYILNITGAIGATIASGTTFKSLDTSTSPDNLYILDNLFTFVAESGLIQVRALNLGTQARLEVGDSLQVTQPISNVDSFQTVNSIITTALEGETTTEYKEKTETAIQAETQGGAKTDIRLWSLDAQGERTSYPYVNSPGIIDLYVEANPEDSVDGNGTPSQAILNDVAEVVEFDPDDTKPLKERGRRSMGIFQINLIAINTLPVDVEIINLSDASFLTTINDAIEAFLFNIRPFIDGADNPNNSQQDLLYEADIYGIVRDVLGISATFETLTVNVDGNPITIYEFTSGDIPYINSVTNV